MEKLYQKLNDAQDRLSEHLQKELAQTRLDNCKLQLKIGELQAENEKLKKDNEQLLIAVRDFKIPDQDLRGLAL